MKNPSITCTLPGTGPVYSALGDEVTVLLSGEQTGGAFTMARVVTQPGGGPPPHVHTLEDEWFFIEEGRIELWRDGDWTEVPAGTAIFLPRGIPHAFRNCGDTPLRFILHTAPAGFEIFYERMAAACSSPEGPDMRRISEIAAQHGISFVPTASV